jgi:ABC-type cobalamin/Fe3+-siderophores transport system ATPase subunit
MSDIFTFSSMSAGYGGTTVLKKLSGCISAGRITALIGPNGSGKSTLLRTLCGFSRYSGQLKLREREVSSITRKEFGRLVGVVSQQVNVKLSFLVYEVISFGRLPYRGLLTPVTAKDDEVITASAEAAGVTHLLCRRIDELSGGERQRVLFAMALAQQPEILLLDEPTSALDPSQSVRVFSVLRRLAYEGRSIVVAAHDINISIPFSDKYIALKDGSITASGNSRELDESVLEPLYGTKFERYVSSKGETAWHPLKESKHF